MNLREQYQKEENLDITSPLGFTNNIHKYAMWLESKLSSPLTDEMIEAEAMTANKNSLQRPPLTVR